MTYRGLTWDHPRGYQALRAAAREHACPITWDVQPLEGFESAPIDELARTYDVIVLDHPHLGDAVRHDSLIPLDSVFTAEELADWDVGGVGRSFASYSLAERQWALPLDAATQVGVLATQDEAPRSWDDAAARSRDVRTALPLAGPHPFLALCAMAIAVGEEPAATPGVFLEADTIGRVLEWLLPLGRASLRTAGVVNPIGVLDLMATEDGPDYCPLVYGYVNYARPGRGRTLRFVDAPYAHPGGRRGSVLGGTGLALSRHCQPGEDLLDHLRWLMAHDTQVSFIPAEAGQPGFERAWLDDAVNADSGEFFRGTLATMRDAWIRPRHAGAVALQHEGAECVRAAIAGDLTVAQLADRLDELARTSPTKEALR